MNPDRRQLADLGADAGAHLVFRQFLLQGRSPVGLSRPEGRGTRRVDRSIGKRDRQLGLSRAAAQPVRSDVVGVLIRVKQLRRAARILFRE